MVVPKWNAYNTVAMITFHFVGCVCAARVCVCGVCGPKRYSKHTTGIADKLYKFTND